MVSVDNQYADAYDRRVRIELERLAGCDRTANAASLAVLTAVTLDDLSRPTPCAGWTLRDLLEHMTAQHHGFAAAARGQGGDESNWQVRPLGDDPLSAYRAAVEDVDSAFAEPGLVSRTCAIPEFTTEVEFSAEQVVGFHLVDGIAHGWDLARTFGQPFELPEEDVEAGWQIASLVPDGEQRREPNAPFAPAIPVDEKASLLDRTVAALGRRPDWSP